MNQNLETIRHSAAHLLAMAVKELYPDTKLGTGPATDDGFYYDFDFSEPLSSDNLGKIQAKMQEIKNRKIPFEQFTLPIEEAKNKVSSINEDYKIEIIEKLATRGETEASFYKNGDEFLDLCAGPHVEDTSKTGSFELTKIAGTYWQGNSDNKMLTRIYGLCFENDKALRLHKKMLEEALKRDHRKIGKKMDLFSFHEEGVGFPFWHNKGMILRNELLSMWREKHKRENYEEISTPIILNEALWHRSGHWQNYKENMYFTQIDEEAYAVKPMNCPGGMLVYKEKPHSYKELPIRSAEIGLVHRHELSGVLHGLFRARNFTQDDAHIFCTKDQIKDEIIGVINLIAEVYDLFDLSFHIELSTRPAKSIGSDEMWEMAESTLKDTLEASGREYKINEGDGAFYGPKLDFHIKDCIGRTWQCATCQLDFSMPERFELEYKGADGEMHRPVMLHRVVFGSLERFIGILIEHFEGLFPTWLAPTQVAILPVNDAHNDYANKVLEEMKANDIRVEFHSAETSLGKRIREAEMSKIPHIIVIGDSECEQKTLTIRRPKVKAQLNLKKEEFIQKLLKRINQRQNDTNENTES